MKRLIIGLSVIPLVLFPYTNGANVATVEIHTEGEIFPDILVSYTDCREYTDVSGLDIKKLGDNTVVNYGFVRPTLGRARFIECSTN